MYKKFFELRVNPFTMNPDPRFLYMTSYTAEALASLAHGVYHRKGFVLLTGEVGTGKTTLINKLLDWLRVQNIASAFIFHPSVATEQFLDMVLADFGIPCEGLLKGHKILRLHHWLLQRNRAGNTAVLIVDEAQTLSREVLEEIRLLTNLETATEKLLQIVLSGQPELEDMLRSPELRQLRQRIALRCKTQPLSLEQTNQYINNRLRLAGANHSAPIFPSETVKTIHRYSYGIPRIVNLLCEHGLIGAFADQQRQVSATTIQSVVREFELDRLPPISGEVAQDSECRRAASTLDEIMAQRRLPADWYNPKAGKR